MYDVFISYSRHDETFVNALEDRLVDAGIDIWIDRHDLPVSLPWLEDVGYAISGSLMVVAVASEAFRASEACASEMRLAAEQGVPILEIDSRLGVTPAVPRIRQAIDRDGVPGRQRAELTRQTADWLRAKRSSRLLVGGGPLRAARRAARRDQLVLSAAGRAFLVASIRRERRRRMFTLLGVAVVALCLLALPVLKSVGELNAEEASDVITELVQNRISTEALEQDPYIGLVVAATKARTSPPDAAQIRDRLMRALAVPVPAYSAEVAAVPAWLAARSCARGGVCRSPPVRGVIAISKPADGVVELRLLDGALRRRITIGAPAGALALSADGRVLAAGHGRDVVLHDTTTAARITRLRGSLGMVRAVAFSDDGRSVTTLSGARRISRWDWRRGRVVVDHPNGWFVALSPVDSAGRVIVFDRAGTMTRVGVTGEAAPRTLGRRLGAPVGTVAFAPRGGRALATVGDELVVVALSSGEVVARARARCRATNAAYAPDGKTAWVTCAGEPLRQVDARTLKEVGSAAVGPLGAVKVVVTDDELLVAEVAFRIVSAGRGRPEKALYSQRCGLWRGLVLAPSTNTMLIVGDGAGKISCTAVGQRGADGAWIFNTHLLPRRPGQQSRAATFSADGRLAAVGYSDGTVTTFTFPHQTPGWVWDGTFGNVRGLTFTRDGSQLVAATREGVVEVLPACPRCFDTKGLAQLALDRVKRARRLGLTTARKTALAEQSPAPAGG